MLIFSCTIVVVKLQHFFSLFSFWYIRSTVINSFLFRNYSKRNVTNTDSWRFCSFNKRYIALVRRNWHNSQKKIRLRVIAVKILQRQSSKIMFVDSYNLFHIVNKINQRSEFSFLSKTTFSLSSRMKARHICRNKKG